MACPSLTSTARLFVQLTAARRASPIASSGSLFEILLPPPARLSLSSRAAAYATTSAPAPWARPSAALGYARRDQRRVGVRPRPAQRAGTISRGATAAFSTTPARLATVALFNPQEDQDGNVMALEITPRAARRLSEIMAKDGNPQLALRIQVEAGGCHGFQYVMRLVTLPPSLPSSAESLSSPSVSDDCASQTINVDDTIFAFSPEAQPAGPAPTEAAAPDSATQEGAAEWDGLSAPKIILDTQSLELLKGSKVDYTMELIGSQFKIVDNPYATSSCGCGTSFDIKF